VDMKMGRMEVLTEASVFATMKGLHKNKRKAVSHFEPKEGQRMFLCSNKTANRCPSLGNYPNPNTMGKEAALRYLAILLVDVAFAQNRHYEG